MNGYWENGQWRANVPYNGGGKSLTDVEKEVEGEVRKAEKGTDAGLLLKALFEKYPQLKANTWDKDPSTHPATPLVHVFAEQRVRR